MSAALEQVEYVSPAQVIPMRRVYGYCSKYTFDVPPIRGLVKRYLMESRVSVDPFARNKRWATYTNDLDPDTAAECHMDAEDFVNMLAARGIKADLTLFDPPYSPRQISECYKGIGLKVGMEETQNAKLYARVRQALLPVVADGGLVISFGWNSGGMGVERGFELVEVLLVYHGAAHNDTICTVERKVESAQQSMFGGGAL